MGFSGFGEYGIYYWVGGSFGSGFVQLFFFFLFVFNDGFVDGLNSATSVAGFSRVGCLAASFFGGERFGVIAIAIPTRRQRSRCLDDCTALEMSWQSPGLGFRCGGDVVEGRNCVVVNM